MPEQTMAIVTRTMTVEEFEAQAARLGRCELINGEVRTMSPAGGKHGNIAARLHYYIGRHVYDNDLGEVYSAETGFVLRRGDSARVRAPDVAFIRTDRAAAAKTPKFIPIPPDLCAEVLSPNDFAGDVNDKVKDWLDFGTRLVWVVDPDNRTIAAYKPDGSARVYRENETLPGEDALPGFQLAVRELFK